RLIVTNIPPVEVGVETHAEMVLCAAASGKWEEGWEVYTLRAREMEAESPGSFTLNTYFFDAVLTLCVAASRVDEGISIMEEVITRNLRPRATMLDKAMLLCAMGAESISKREETEGGTEQQLQLERKKFEQRGLELWALFDFYQLPRSTASVLSYMRMCCAIEKPTLVLEAQSFADTAGIPLSLECFYWLVYALRGVTDFGDYIMDVFSQLTPRGLTPDFVLFTLAFMHCALQRDGELALAVYDQHFIHMNINPTPEMTLLFIQSCAHCEEPRVAMLERCEKMLLRLEEVGSSVDYIVLIYDQFLELCGHLGAVASGFSMLKKLVGLGKPLTTRMLNSLLLANAYATPPNGSIAMTEEIVRLFSLLKLPPNKDTSICLGFCIETFGDSPSLNAFSAIVHAKCESGDDASLYDEDIPLAQPATSTWCQGLVLFAREEAKRLLPIRCPRRGRRRRTNGSEGHQMEPFTWLPAERYFYPLLNSIGAYQRYTYRLRAVCDAQRQKLLLSGDIEQNPGPIAVLQMNVSCLTPSKLATLMAQGADIIAIQETWKSSEQIASMHTGD
ncbi:putative protein transport protein Sec23A, partial [Trypanosoma cruzi]